MIDAERAVDVCVITTIHQPWDARIYDRGAVTLAEAGMRVRLIAPWPAPESPTPGIELVSLEPAVSRTARLLHSGRTFRAALASPARVYVFHDLDFLPFALLLHVLTGRPVVYDCHENYPEEVRFQKDWIPRPLRRPAAWAVRLAEGGIANRLGNVIAAAPSVRDRLRRFVADPVLIRNLARIAVRRDAVPGVNLLCIGSITLSYGSAVLLAIGRELRVRGIDAELVITEKFGDESIREEFLRCVHAESLPVRILPRVPASRIGEVLAEGFVGLAVEQDYPAKRLAVPTKLFEYMSHGLPAIASDLPGTRAILDQVPGSVLVSPDSASAYVDAFLRLRADAAEYARAREAAFRAAESTFAWEPEAARLVQYFRALLQSAG